MPTEEAKNRVFELAKRLMKLRSEERMKLNEIDNIRRQISETEIELSQIIELSEARRA